jgi:ribosome biogenesis GTPase
LEDLGWTKFFAEQMQHDEIEDLFPARVSEENRGAFRILSESGESLAEISGKLRHEAKSRANLPAVGDWILARLNPGAERATIHRVLQRRSKFSRKIAGRKTEEQIVAANIDTIFLVTALNHEFNIRRLERYLTLAWDSGARPIILLNKCDLCENADEIHAETEGVASGAQTILTSATRGDGIDELRSIVRGGTSAFLGSSGVGKSSLINALLGSAKQAVKEIRQSDDRGKHTTTARQLLLVPGGGIVIDTPGMRELQLWDAGEGVEQTFSDVDSLATTCRFRNCTHREEPGCAVRAAIENGELDSGRLQSLQKLRREEEFQDAKHDAALRSERTKAVRRIMKDYYNRLDRFRDQ